VNELAGIKESDTGLSPPALWDLAADKQALQSRIIKGVPTTGRGVTPQSSKILFLFGRYLTQIFKKSPTPPPIFLISGHP